jgi:hypothetical protein
VSPPRESRPAATPGGHPRTECHDSSATGRRCVSSQQVNWWTVHKFVGAVLNEVNDWPTLGTPAWCSLAHDDPRKWAALLDGAQHWALRMDSCQEASRAVSSAVDWPAVSKEIKDLREFHAGRPWLERVAS